jgi:hypothetical protein
MFIRVKNVLSKYINNKLHVLCPIQFSVSLAVYKIKKREFCASLEAITEQVHKNNYAVHTILNLANEY